MWWKRGVKRSTSKICVEVTTNDLMYKRNRGTSSVKSTKYKEGNHFLDSALWYTVVWECSIGRDRIAYCTNDVNSMDNNQHWKSPLWDPNLSPSSPSRTYDQDQNPRVGFFRVDCHRHCLHHWRNKRSGLYPCCCPTLASGHRPWSHIAVSCC